MPEVIGIDHIYISVTDLSVSEKFYDIVMNVLEFRKKPFILNEERHIQYYNRHFGYVLRPARIASAHNPYSPGLHHFCLRVESEHDVYTAAHQLQAKGVVLEGPKRSPEYAHDYVAVYLSDPDAIQLEITNYRQERRERHDQWQNTDI